MTEDCAEEVRSEILGNLKADDLIEIVVAREFEPNHIFEAKRLREELTVVVDALQVSIIKNNYSFECLRKLKSF